MWEALRREDHKPLDLLVTDKEEVCTRLVQLPCTGMHTRHKGRDTEELLIGMLESLRVKCRRAHRRQEKVVRDSPRSKQREEAMDLKF